MLVDHDRATLRHLEPRGGRERRFGAHANRHDDEIDRDRPGGAEIDDDRTLGPRGESLRRGGEVQPHALRLEVVFDLARHLGVEHPHHVLRRFHQRHVEAPIAERFGDLQSDVPAAHDDRAARAAVHHRLDRVHVGDRAQREDPRVIDARQRRLERCRARCQDEPIVVLVVGAARRALDHANLLCFALDRDHFVPGAHVEREGLAQALRCLQEQRRALFDLAADVIRQPAVGERDVVVALQHEDLGAFVEPPQPCGCGHSTGNTSHDHDPAGGSLSELRCHE